MASHLRVAHKVKAEAYAALCTIDDGEREAMKNKYNASSRGNGKKKLKDVPSYALSVSLDHISSVVIRCAFIILLCCDDVDAVAFEVIHSLRALGETPRKAPHMLLASNLKRTLCRLRRRRVL